jgi:predicted ATP-grasp superfamily ATP-dependent carboligase
VSKDSALKTGHKRRGLSRIKFWIKDTNGNAKVKSVHIKRRCLHVFVPQAGYAMTRVLTEDRINKPVSE